MNTWIKSRRKCMERISDLVLRYRKKIRRKTPYTYASDVSAQNRKEKESHFRSQNQSIS